MTSDQALMAMELEAVRAFLLCWFLTQFWFLPRVGELLFRGLVRSLVTAYRMVRRRRHTCVD